MRNSRGGMGPLIHFAVALPAFLNGNGTQLYLNDFADSRIQTGIGNAFSLDSEAFRMCRVWSCGPGLESPSFE
jgi:hypothetical protein